MDLLNVFADIFLGSVVVFAIIVSVFMYVALLIYMITDIDLIYMVGNFVENIGDIIVDLVNGSKRREFMIWWKNLIRGK